MRLFTPLAVAAGPLVTVTAIVVPLSLPLPPARDSFPPARVPAIAESDHRSLRRTEDTDAPDTLPGRRIGRLGGYNREHRAAAPLVSSVTKGVVRVVVVSTTTSTEFETVTTTGTITPAATPSTTSAPSSSSFSRSCDLRYCDAGTSYCEYWGGYSSFDVSQGRPIPGETRTSIGVCSTRASPGPVDSTTSASASTSSSSTAFSSSYDPLDSITCTSTIKTSA